MIKGEIEIYTTDKGTEIQVKLEQDTVWLNAHMMADLFGVQRPAIVKHINNIYKSNELAKESTCSKMEQVAGDGKLRKMNLYNLDMIISVGYRVNSPEATQFRIWATQRLKDYLIRGYAINKKRLAQKEMEVYHLKTGIKILRRTIENKEARSAYEWLEYYAKGLQLLDDFDHENLDSQGIHRKSAHYPAFQEYRNLIEEMKQKFESSIFGIEKDKGFESAVSQIEQSFAGEDLYPGLEDKAAMLLYLITKNHAFADGNKRIAAACFLLFLERNGILTNKDNEQIISNEALASLTLFVAASNSEEMETVKNVIVSVLNRNQ